jgi:hypothetical protein
MMTFDHATRRYIDATCNVVSPGKPSGKDATLRYTPLRGCNVSRPHDAPTLRERESCPCGEAPMLGGFAMGPSGESATRGRRAPRLQPVRGILNRKNHSGENPPVGNAPVENRPLRGIEQ